MIIGHHEATKIMTLFWHLIHVYRFESRYYVCMYLVLVVIDDQFSNVSFWDKGSRCMAICEMIKQESTTLTEKVS